tara:strand:+ start:1402 stop:1671 length:270 start_codon:yes stop_codon:yes gene_type:complete
MNEELLKMFMSGQVRVIFRRKGNGIIRSLLGTLNKDDIPPEQYDTLSSILDGSSNELIVVWDIERNDWRSFYFYTVIDIFQSKVKKELE